MLALTEQALKEFNPSIRVELFGQELNGESFGICKSDMLVTGHDPEPDCLRQYADERCAQGEIVSLHAVQSALRRGLEEVPGPDTEEAQTLGTEGRFGAGLPRISDGQLLFLQHMISKMRDDETGSRIGIVMNGSPLFTGGANSGESEIRRWMLENDWVEAIVALPTDLFYNTGIQTYVWLLTNRKPAARRGKVQLIDASGERFWKSMRKSLGSKRREIPEAARKEVVRIYAEMLNGNSERGEFSKTFDTTDFGYREVRIERPLRLNFQAAPERIERLKVEKGFQKLDANAQAAILEAVTRLPSTLFTNRDEFDKALTGELKVKGIKIGATVKKAILLALSERDDDADICTDKSGEPEPDTDLRDHELVPLKEDWREYVVREVKPFVPDAWVDENHRDARDAEVGRVGYEINFNRYFYRYVPPRPLEEIDVELKTLEAEIAGLLREVSG